MSWRKSMIFFFSIILCTASIFGQESLPSDNTAKAEEIYLTNSSFEDYPHHSKPPRGWNNCGFIQESPPDVQPSGQFGVTKPAYDGETYLGMVVRDNDTWEAVGQRLSTPMERGQCYSFSIYLAKSELYLSPSRTQANNQEVNYVTPAKLRIYGGFDYCDKQYMLGETSLIINERWIEYNFKFEPIDDYTHITFEAFYKTPTLFPYNGNVLMDKASSLRPIPCDEEPQSQEEVEEEVSEVETPGKPVVTPAPTTAPEPSKEVVEKKPTQLTPKPAEVTPPKIADKEVDTPQEAKTFTKDLTRDELIVGQKLRLESLFFRADSTNIEPGSIEALNEVYEFLSNNKDLVVEVGGHTNGLPEDAYCDWLSNARAKAVVDFLIFKGIDKNRLRFKGYGKNQPIATDETAAGRRKNQRVEIKILSKSGK